jgi:hypothetical protein
LTETILLTPGNVTALATARRAISRHPAKRTPITPAPRSRRSPPPERREQSEARAVCGMSGHLIKRFRRSVQCSIGDH